MLLRMHAVFVVTRQVYASFAQSNCGRFAVPDFDKAWESHLKLVLSQTFAGSRVVYEMALYMDGYVQAATASNAC